jgi:hypothetical protein
MAYEPGQAGIRARNVRARSFRSPIIGGAKGDGGLLSKKPGKVNAICRRVRDSGHAPPGVMRRRGFEPSPVAAAGRNVRQGQTMIGNFHALGNSREARTIMERKLRDENVSAR